MLVFLAHCNRNPIKTGIAVHLLIPRDPEPIQISGTVGIQILDEWMEKQGIQDLVSLRESVPHPTCVYWRIALGRTCRNMPVLVTELGHGHAYTLTLSLSISWGLVVSFYLRDSRNNPVCIMRYVAL